MQLDLTDEKSIQKIWEKGLIVDNFNPQLVRKDACGAWIVRNAYGNRNNAFGWEIDHIFPTTLGGDENEINLRPLQWENNLSKSNDYPSYNAAVQSDGNNNVRKSMQYTVNAALQEKLRKIYQ